MVNSNNPRRNFLKNTFVLGASLIAGATMLKSQNVRAERRRGGGADASAASGAGLPLLDPTKPNAVAVNYNHDKAKITKADLKADRGGVKFNDQHCSNCSFYKSVGKKDGKEVGTCTIFAQNVVRGEGWCSSWNKKA